GILHYSYGYVVKLAGLRDNISGYTNQCRFGGWPVRCRCKLAGPLLKTVGKRVLTAETQVNTFTTVTQGSFYGHSVRTFGKKTFENSASAERSRRGVKSTVSAQTMTVSGPFSGYS